jgi:hypothetical protein
MTVIPQPQVEIDVEGGVQLALHARFRFGPLHCTTNLRANTGDDLVPSDLAPMIGWDELRPSGSGRHDAERDEPVAGGNAGGGNWSVFSEHDPYTARRTLVPQECQIAKLTDGWALRSGCAQGRRPSWVARRCIYFTFGRAPPE